MGLINENKKVSSGEIKAANNFGIYGFIIGVVILIIALVIKALTIDIAGINSQILFQIFKSSPELLIFILFPFILSLLGIKISKQKKNEHTFLRKSLHEKEKIINRNADLAKTIGDKDFNIDEKAIEKDDELSKALIAMRQNLVQSSQKEEELNWIARGKDLISNILRQHNIVDVLAYETLVNLIEYVNAIQGAFYIYEEEKEKLISVATYAYNRKKYVTQEFKIGEGLIGQAAYEMDIIYRREIPEDYITISSGILGDKKPRSILIVPLISDEKLQGIIEFASLEATIPNLTIKFVKELGDIIGQTIFNLKVNIRTEKLLKEAQILTKELKQNEEALRKNAVEMEKTQIELEKSNRNLEAQIVEVENAQKRLYTLLENASEIISIYDDNELVTYESPSVKRILGYSPEDIIGKNAFEEIHTIATKKLKSAFTSLLENPEIPQTVEFQFQKKNGEILWLETTGRNMLTNPAINGVIFNTRDITVRKIAEKAQRMSGQMQALSENSPDMIVRLGPSGKFFYVNPIVEQFTGVITNNIINKNLLEVSLDSRIVNFFNSVLEKVVTTKQKQDIETVFPTIMGDRIMLVNAIPEFNDEEEMESVLFVAHDITEMKNIEQEIMEKNKNISDSINYAQRIQTSLLPDIAQVKKNMPNSFIFFLPKDVVSGDLPWFHKKGDDIYIAAIDCTGHGVPGALLSVIAYFVLNNSVDQLGHAPTGEILDLFHEDVRKTLKQDRIDANARDGMDIALCKVNFKEKIFEFSGAHRPLYLLRNKQLTQYKGSPKAIGGIPDKRKEEKNFTTHTVSYFTGDKIFFFSDGLTDQIGGPKGRKYQASRIRDLIIENSEFSMDEFSKLFAKDFGEWRGENKQIDDVILIGIEF